MTGQGHDIEAARADCASAAGSRRRAIPRQRLSATASRQRQLQIPRVGISTVTSPRVAAARERPRHRQRSGPRRRRCAVGCSSSTSVISHGRRAESVDLRTAPASILHKSTISGSRAALSMTVVPLGENSRGQDVLGARRRSGNQARSVAPRSPFASAMMLPCSVGCPRPSVLGRQSACRAARRSRRPGQRHFLPDRCGPAAVRGTQIDPRIFAHQLVHGASDIEAQARASCALSTRPCTDSVTCAADRPSSSCIVLTSEIAGRLSIAVSPAQAARLP